MSLQRLFVQRYFAIQHAVMGDKGAPASAPGDAAPPPGTDNFGPCADENAPDAFERVRRAPSAPLLRHLPVAVDAAALDAAAAAATRSSANGSRRPQHVRAPAPLQLSEATYLQALDAHFDACGGLRTGQASRPLDAAFLRHMRIVDDAQEQEATRLARALWNGTLAEAGVRALAEADDLPQRLAAAARTADVALAPDDVVRGAALLRLAGLEACRSELYGELFSAARNQCRQISARFGAEDCAWAMAFLTASGLGDEADAFLLAAPEAGGLEAPAPGAGPDAVRAADADKAERHAARRDFEGMLSYYLWLLCEAQLPPSLRDEGHFYPPPPSYDGSGRASPATFTDEAPPAYDPPPAYLREGTGADVSRSATFAP